MAYKLVGIDENGLLPERALEALDRRFGVMNSVYSPDAVYVSSEGSDINNGRSGNSSVLTIEKALEILGDGGGTVYIRENDTIVCSELLSFTLDKHRIVGQNSTLDFRTAPGGNCITWNGNGAHADIRAGSYMDGLILLGNNPYGSSATNPAQTAIRLNGTASNTHTANSNFNNVALQEFSIGISIGDHTWDVTFTQCTIRHCGTGISNLNGTENAGALIKFTDCRIFQCGTFYHQTRVNGTILFTGCSWSHCYNKFGIQTTGQVTLVSTQVEINMDSAGPYFEFSGGGTAFLMSGGSFAATPPPRNTEVLIQNDCPLRNSIVFRDVEMHEMWDKDGWFSRGPGMTTVIGEQYIGGASTTHAVTCEATNLVNDYKMSESDQIATADWYVSSDAETPPSRTYNGTNGNMIKGSGPLVEGAVGVARITKSVGTGNNFTMSLLVPVTHRAGLLHYKLKAQRAAGANTPVLRLQAVYIDYDHGIPHIARSETIRERPLTEAGTGAGSDYITLTNQSVSSYRMPFWANAIRFQVDMRNNVSGTVVIVANPYISLT